MKYTTGYLFRRLGLGFKDDETVKALLDRDMRHLELTNSITTDCTLNNIFEICPNLQELILAGSSCVFTEIGKICFFLYIVHLFAKFRIYTIYVLFVALQHFIPRMKNLTFLSLKGLADITDKSISGLTYLEHLMYLNLKRCTGLTDDCGKTLRLIKLQRLDMSYTSVFVPALS